MVVFFWGVVVVCVVWFDCDEFGVFGVVYYWWFWNVLWWYGIGYGGLVVGLYICSGFGRYFVGLVWILYCFFYWWVDYVFFCFGLGICSWWVDFYFWCDVFWVGWFYYFCGSVKGGCFYVCWFDMRFCDGYLYDRFCDWWDYFFDCDLFFFFVNVWLVLVCCYGFLEWGCVGCDDYLVCVCKFCLGVGECWWIGWMSFVVLNY